MEKAEEKQKSELVRVEVLIPKQVYDFLKAAHDFGKWKQSLEEYLGYQIVFALEGDFNNCLDGLLNIKEIFEGYSLDKVVDLKIDSNVLDC